MNQTISKSKNTTRNKKNQTNKIQIFTNLENKIFQLYRLEKEQNETNSIVAYLNLN